MLYRLKTIKADLFIYVTSTRLGGGPIGWGDHEFSNNTIRFSWSFIHLIHILSENVFTCRIIYPMNAIDINASQYPDLSVHNLEY